MLPVLHLRALVVDKPFRGFRPSHVRNQMTKPCFLHNELTQVGCVVFFEGTSYSRLVNTKLMTSVDPPVCSAKRLYINNYV